MNSDTGDEFPNSAPVDGTSVPEFEQALKGALHASLPPGMPRETELSLRALSARIADHESAPVSRQSADMQIPTPKRVSARAGLWTVLGLSLAVAAGAVGYATYQHGPAAGHTSVLREYATKSGQRARIRLADGTSIELNVASRLRVPADFGSVDRRVYLDGEARFTVTANAQHPFIVEAGGATIRDLSTAFNIRAYPGSAATQVAVTDGRVTVASRAIAPHNRATVGVNHVATVGADGTTRVEAVADIAPYVGWTRGVLTFEDAPLGQVLTELSRWYNVEFRLDDARLAANRVTMTVHATTFTREFARDFAESIDARITKIGDVYVLTHVNSSPSR